MMQVTLSLSLLVAAAAAQTSFVTPTAATSAPTTTATSLSALVDQLPKCALSCFASAAKDINCSASDFKCLCANSQTLLTKLAPCVALSSCSSSDIGKAQTLAPQICLAANNNPDPADVASASSIVTAAVSSSSHNAAPARTEMPMAVMGIAGFAGAVAALAL